MVPSMMPLHDTVSLTISRLQFEQVLQHRAELAEEAWERTKENLEKSASRQQWLDERLTSSRQKNAYLEGEAAASTKAGMVLDKVSKRSEIAHEIMLDLTVLPHNASQDRRQAAIVAAAAGRKLISERTKSRKLQGELDQTQRKKARLEASIIEQQHHTEVFHARSCVLVHAAKVRRAQLLHRFLQTIQKDAQRLRDEATQAQRSKAVATDLAATAAMNLKAQHTELGSLLGETQKANQALMRQRAERTALTIECQRLQNINLVGKYLLPVLCLFATRACLSLMPNNLPTTGTQHSW